jgi:hypothetical protein
MPILSYSTISDPSFVTATYSQSLHNNYGNLPLSDAKVYEFPTVVSSHSYAAWQLTLTSSSANFSLCLDNFFFFSWAYLNLDAASFSLGNYDNLAWSNLQPLTQAQSPFAQYFDHSNICNDYSS